MEPQRPKPPKIFGSKNLFSIDHLTHKNSLISTVPLFSKSDYKWRRYRRNCDFGIVMRENVGRGWTVRHYHYGSYPGRKFFFRKFIFFSLSDAEKFAEFYGATISEIWPKNGGDIGMRWRIEGGRLLKSWSATMPQFTRKCRQADRKLANPPLRYMVY